MKTPLLSVFVFGACAAFGQNLETFTRFVRPSDTFFAGGWSTSTQQPATSFLQGVAQFEIKGVTNSSSGWVDVYAPADGRAFDIGTSGALEVSAKILAGNEADSFRVFLLDVAGNSASATFRAADFSTADYQLVGAALAKAPGFNPGAIERIRISGDKLGGVGAFAFGFRELSAVARAGGDGSLRNFSLRAQVGTGANVLIAGFIVDGSATKQVLARAVGPGLTAFGVTGALLDPELKLFRGSTVVASNDNWTTDAAMTAAVSKGGAFSLVSGSRDAALATALSPGLHTAQVGGVGGASGVALFELYDVDPGVAFPQQRLINVSARAPVGAGDAQLIAAFVVSGRSTKRVLIRAAGPALAAFGMGAGSVADPQLKLVRVVSGAEQVVAENDNWETGNDRAQISSAAVAAGAFPFASGSRDAALLVTLAPGAYATVATGNAGTTGLALIEIYEVP